MEIDWTKIIARKNFVVAGNEVIFFVDDSNILFVFISFPEKDKIERTGSQSTESEALRVMNHYNIQDARMFYYRMIKEA